MVIARNPSIFCVGSSMVDLITYLERMPQPGETIFGRGFAQGFGGKGANQAVMAAILGARVTMVNSVGDDTFGRETISNFEEFGVDTEFVLTSPGDYSGVANILVDPDGDNRIVLGAGANEAMTVAQVDRAFDARAEPAVVLSQLEIPQPVILQGFRRAKAGTAVTVLNPGPAGRIDPAILERTDWLIPNETEFATIFASVFGEPARHETSDVTRLADALSTRIVVTMGAQGALWANDDGIVEHFPVPDVRVVDTTGAGDAFCGAFAFAIASGWTPGDAIPLAVALASASVTKRGTQVSYPTGEVLRSIVADHAPGGAGRGVDDSGQRS